jgi:hypothetical protein
LYIRVIAEKYTMAIRISLKKKRCPELKMQNEAIAMQYFRIMNRNNINILRNNLLEKSVKDKVRNTPSPGNVRSFEDRVNN